MSHGVGKAGTTVQWGQGFIDMAPHVEYIPEPAARPASIGLINVGRRVVVGLSKMVPRSSGSRGVAASLSGWLAFQ